MAHIYAGNAHLVDRDILAAVSHLPDDFWVYAEFDCNRRNIDVLIVRAVPDDRPAHRHSTVILTEVKRTEAQLSGGEYGRWTETRNGLTKELLPGNVQDENHWRQAINTVNQLRSWLFFNQPRFLDQDGVVGLEQEVKVWPNLLVLSPPDVQHRLPLAPVSRFGAFHYNLQEWFEKAAAWTPREGLRITAVEAERLATVLDLQTVQPLHPVQQIQPMPNGQPVRIERAGSPVVAADAPRPGNGGAVRPAPHSWREGFVRAASLHSQSTDQFMAWADGIEQRLAAIEAQLRSQPAPRPQPAPFVPVAPAAPAPSMTPDLAALITEAVSNIRLASKRRDFPTLGQELNYLIGPRLRDTQYFGFVTLRALMDEAVARRLVAYGPPDGNGPSVYLPNEPIPRSNDYAPRPIEYSPR